MNAVLIGEGPTDRSLVAPLNWLLRESTPAETTLRWVEAFRLPRARTLAERIAAVRRVEKFDLLFVHRDADAGSPDDRYREIVAAADGVQHVCVVPVRMTESWMLPHEAAIREACGRPSSREDLGLPPVSRIERTADPKAVLRTALETAMNVRPGRRHRQDPMQAYYRVSELVDDWSVLRGLAAFRRLEADTRDALIALGLPVLAARG